MKVKFKNIYIENFCSIKQLDAPLYERTVISGQNGTGKSTISKRTSRKPSLLMQ